MGTYNFQGGTIKDSAIGDNAVYNGNKTAKKSVIEDFEKALTLIKGSSLDSQIVVALCNLLSTAKEASEKNDERQKEDVKSKFKWFWSVLGKNAKTVLSILSECSTVLEFFGLKP